MNFSEDRLQANSTMGGSLVPGGILCKNSQSERERLLVALADSACGSMNFFRSAELYSRMRTVCQLTVRMCESRRANAGSRLNTFPAVLVAMALNCLPSLRLFCSSTDNFAILAATSGSSNTSGESATASP
jgi:hypothetical protein